MSEKLILGRNTEFDIHNELGINAHVCVFGGSGTGKSFSIVKPNLLNVVEEGSSIVVSDPKGALEKEFKELFMEKGYKTYSIDLINPQNSSCTFNPLDYICSEIDIIKLSHRMVYSDSLAKQCISQDPYWNRQAEIALSMLIHLVLLVEEEGKETLDKVIYYASNLTSDGCGITNMLMEKIAKERPNSLAAKQWRKMEGLMSAEKTFSCVVSSVQEHLGRYEGEEMTSFFEKKQRIYFDDFAREKSVLFIKVSDTDSSYYNFANLIYALAIDALCMWADEREDGRCVIPVRFIMDDFGTNSFVDEMPRIISTARARNISFMLVCQSVQQLRMGYKDDAQTIISNCDHIVLLGTNDVTTAQEFSARLDIPVSDILSKKRGRIYIFRTGEKPIEDERYDYREHGLYGSLQKSIRG